MHSLLLVFLLPPVSFIPHSLLVQTPIGHDLGHADRRPGLLRKSDLFGVVLDSSSSDPCDENLFVVILHERDSTAPVKKRAETVIFVEDNLGKKFLLSDSRVPDIRRTNIEAHVEGKVDVKVTNVQAWDCQVVGESWQMAQRGAKIPYVLVLLAAIVSAPDLDTEGVVSEISFQSDFAEAFVDLDDRWDTILDHIRVGYVSEEVTEADDAVFAGRELDDVNL